MSTIFVATRDYGYEGYDLPVLAFRTKEEALAWAREQSREFCEIFPDLPTGDATDLMDA